MTIEKAFDLAQYKKWRKKICHSFFLYQLTELDTIQEVSDNQSMGDG